MELIAKPYSLRALGDFLLARYKILLVILLGLSLAMRFWILDRFDFFVFDEVYFARFAVDYINQQVFYDVHPPLGKLIIALGTKLSNELAFLLGVNLAPDDYLKGPFGYRCANALIGSFIPLFMAGIALNLARLSGQRELRARTFGLLAGLLTLLDGFLLTESRYAFNNIALIFFGLLGLLLFLKGFQSKTNQLHRLLWHLGAGLSLGLSVGCKWSGLGYLGAVFALLGIGFASRLCLLFLPRSRKLLLSLFGFLKITELFNKRAAYPWLPALSLPICFGLIPLLAYLLVLAPHFQINKLKTSELYNYHKGIYDYHHNLGLGKTDPQSIHPYCAVATGWPIMLRPIAYVYETSPAALGRTGFTRAVIGMGNPLLWWFGILAFVPIVIGLVVSPIARHFRLLPASKRSDLFTQVFLLLNFSLLYFPFLGLKRCLFLYHYLPAVCFAFCALALVFTNLLQSRWRWVRLLVWGLIASIVWSFVYWAPLFYGLNISSKEVEFRFHPEKIVGLNDSKHHFFRWI